MCIVILILLSFCPVQVQSTLNVTCKIDIFQELQPALADPGGGAEEDSGDATEGAVPVQLKGVVLIQQIQQHSLAVGAHLREQRQQSTLILVNLFQSIPGDSFI